MRLVEIAVFPVKSARGASIPSAVVEARGLAGDRRWMLVDRNGRAVTQREVPQLARLGSAFDAGSLRLGFEEHAVEIGIPDAAAPRQPVTIWKDTLALPESPEGSAFLSKMFGRDLRLFHQPDDAHRPVDEWGRAGDEVNLSDGFPILVATPASLEAVRRAAAGSFGMERFRPNLVIDGADAWAEDSWSKIRVGGIELDLVKPCARCTVTTVDQAEGRFDGEEPLATLRRIRMSGDRRVAGVLFGWNAVPRSFGALRVGDPVDVISARAPWPILPERIYASA